MIRIVRKHILEQVLAESPKRRQPFLQVNIDLTTLVPNPQTGERPYMTYFGAASWGGMGANTAQVLPQNSP